MTTLQEPTHATGRYELSHLRALEAEAIHIIREVAAEFERPVLLFSGGKDSIVMLHLARKAFRPGRLPFPVMHVDTGHNFGRSSRPATNWSRSRVCG
jgi:sulfate adenylyltransferase subunit 2